MRFLGLVLTETCRDWKFTDDVARSYPRLAISGEGSEAQVMEALLRYRDRMMYAQNALYNLFKQTQTLPPAPRVDLIKVNAFIVRL